MNFEQARRFPRDTDATPHGVKKTSNLQSDFVKDDFCYKIEADMIELIQSETSTEIDDLDAAEL